MVELLGERPRRAGELAEVLAVSPWVMSRHLEVRRDSALVEGATTDVDAPERVCSLRAGPTQGLTARLDEVEQGWAEQLASSEAHVEGRR